MKRRREEIQKINAQQRAENLHPKLPDESDFHVSASEPDEKTMSEKENSDESESEKHIVGDKADVLDDVRSFKTETLLLKANPNHFYT